MRWVFFLLQKQIKKSYSPNVPKRPVAAPSEFGAADLTRNEVQILRGSVFFEKRKFSFALPGSDPARIVPRSVFFFYDEPIRDFLKFSTYSRSTLIRVYFLKKKYI